MKSYDSFFLAKLNEKNIIYIIYSRVDFMKNASGFNGKIYHRAYNNIRLVASFGEY